MLFFSGKTRPGRGFSYQLYFDTTAEAMKMETEVHANIAGTVQAVHVSKGDRVTPGEVLIEIG